MSEKKCGDDKSPPRIDPITLSTPVNESVKPPQGENESMVASEHEQGVGADVGGVGLCSYDEMGVLTQEGDKVQESANESVGVFGVGAGVDHEATTTTREDDQGVGAVDDGRRVVREGATTSSAPILEPYEGIFLPCDGLGNKGRHFAFGKSVEQKILKMAAAPGTVSSDRYEGCRRILLKKWFGDGYQPRMTLSNFKFGSSLGIGSFGKVYEASFGGKTVAVKQITFKVSDPEDVYKERDLMILLDHKRVCKLLGAFYEGNCFLVMELCCGTVAGLFDAFRPLHKLCFAIQFLEGLAWIHSKNVVHADLKMDNLLVGKDGMLRISDFGSAFILPEGVTEVKADKSLGVAFYQEAETNREYLYSKQSDIFTACCVLFELTSVHHLLRYSYDVDADEYIDACVNGRKRIICKADFKKKDVAREPLTERVELSELGGLLKRMLAPKQERISAQEALDHPDLQAARERHGVTEEFIHKSTPKVVNWDDAIIFRERNEMQLSKPDVKHLTPMMGIYYDAEESMSVSESQGVGAVAAPLPSTSTAGSQQQQGKGGEVLPKATLDAPAEKTGSEVDPKIQPVTQTIVSEMVKKAVSEALAALQMPSKPQYALDPTHHGRRLGIGGNIAGTPAPAEGKRLKDSGTTSATFTLDGIRKGLGLFPNSETAAQKLPPPPPVYIKPPPEPSGNKHSMIPKAKPNAPGSSVGGGGGSSSKGKRSVSPLAQQSGAAPELFTKSGQKASSTTSNKVVHRPSPAQDKKSKASQELQHQKQQHKKQVAAPSSSSGVKSSHHAPKASTSTDKVSKKRKETSPPPKSSSKKHKKQPEPDEEETSEEESEEEEEHEFECPFCGKRNEDEEYMTAHMDRCKKNPNRKSKNPKNK